MLGSKARMTDPMPASGPFNSLVMTLLPFRRRGMICPAHGRSCPRVPFRRLGCGWTQSFRLKSPCLRWTRSSHPVVSPYRLAISSNAFHVPPERWSLGPSRRASLAYGGPTKGGQAKLKREWLSLALPLRGLGPRSSDGKSNLLGRDKALYGGSLAIAGFTPKGTA